MQTLPPSLQDYKNKVSIHFVSCKYNIRFNTITVTKVT